MSDIQQRSTLNTTNCLTQIMLTKRLYLEASSFAVRHDAVSSGIAISMFQDAIELYIWTLIKERNLSAKDQAGLVSHIECLQKASINIPNAAKLLELNKARVGFKHYGNLPARSEIKKFQSYVEEFFRLAMLEHFGIKFDTLSLVDLVGNENVRTHLKLAEEKISLTEHQEAAGELAKAKALLFIALNRYMPQVDYGLRSADQILNSIGGMGNSNAFAYLSDYLGVLREYTLVSLLRLSLRDYNVLRRGLPNAIQSHSGKWYLTYYRGNYTAEECNRALICIINLSVQLEAFQ